MYWGFKSRFTDLEDVLKFNPKSVEFHLTDEDVKNGTLNGKIYDCNYSIHLPEYWQGCLINPCQRGTMSGNLKIYKTCIKKGLSLRNNFKYKDKMKVIMHPGGMSVDPIHENHRMDLYLYLNNFLWELYESLKDYKDEFEILVENMPPLPWFYGGQYYSNIYVKPDEIAFYEKEFCLDISHLGLYCNHANEDLIKAIEFLKPHVAQIHLADADGTDGEGAKMGEGNVDFKKVTEVIKDLDVAVIPEVMWGHKDGYKAFTDIIKECNKWLT